MPREGMNTRMMAEKMPGKVRGRVTRKKVCTGVAPRSEDVLSTLYSVLIYTVLYIPVVVMMIFSFNDQRYNYYWNGFTTQW